MKSFSRWCLLSFVLLVLIAGCGGPAKKADQMINQPAKDFSLSDLENNQVSLANFKDKIVVLNFWATWCSPCKKEIPDFVDLHKKYREKGVVVVGIALDEEGLTVVKPFIQEYKVNYPILLGNEQIAKDYGGIIGVPTSFILDGKGNVYKKYVGYRPVSEYESDIDALLKAQ